MKRRWLYITGILTMLVFAGCGKKKNTEQEKIKIHTEYGDVTVKGYKGLSAEKSIYTVTEEDIQGEIEILLSDYIEYKNVSRNSKSGDTLTINFTAKKEETTLEDYTDEEVEITLGEEEYGEEVDKQLTGLKPGEEKKFTVTYPDDYEYEGWAGETVTFDVTVKHVSEKIMPKVTDKFVKETLGYESKDVLNEEVKAWLEQSNEMTSESELGEELLTQVLDRAETPKISDEFYKSLKEEVEAEYEPYMSNFGYSNKQEFYDAVGITDDLIDEEVQALGKRKMVVQAIAQNENLSITDEEYESGVEEYVAEYGYESKEELLKQYKEATIRELLLKDKVVALLRENATITEKMVGGSSY